MDGESSRQKEQTRIAYLITIVLLLAIALVFVENANRQKTISESTEISGWYIQIGDMIGRLKSFRERNSIFFSQVLFEHVVNDWGCDHERSTCKSLGFRRDFHTSIDGTHHNGAVKGDFDLYRKVDEQTEKSGQAIADLFKKAGPITIENIDAIIAAHMDVEYALRISSKDRIELAEIKNTNAWPKMVQWIVFGNLHIPFSSGPTIHFVGYRQQDGGVSRERLKRHISDQLRLQSDLPGIEAIVVREWESAFAAYVTKNRGPSNFGILGSEIKLESLQYIVALSLAYTGLLFLFAVTLRLDAITPRPSSDVPAKLSFPDYGRFQSTAPALDSSTAFMCAALWWSFVSAPVLLLSLGVLYRYVMPIGNSAIFSPLGIAMVVKIPDNFSLACDIINLICLLVCFASMFMVEQLKARRKSSRRFLLISGIVGAASLLALTSAYNSVSHSYGSNYAMRAYYTEVVLVSIWIVVAIYSAWRSSRGIWLLSIIFLTAYATLAIPFVRS